MILIIFIINKPEIMIYITRKEHFSSAHKLNNNILSEAENKEIYGKCNDFHGHNYYLEVTLKGTPDPDSGYVMDLKKLKRIIQTEILEKVDHKYLNDLDIFKDTIPTTERMAIVFWNLLESKVKSDNARLYSVKLYETAKNYVEYLGEE
ncbi:MAG TPA: 6-carboxytetrahydropterin synthase [Ignavibacteria bacterium]|nr:6-carboxytetrahydropterin synthase [Ignavibacteria bacterium]